MSEKDASGGKRRRGKRSANTENKLCNKGSKAATHAPRGDDDKSTAAVYVKYAVVIVAVVVL